MKTENTTTVQKLTVSEAIAQGYKSCGYPDGEFQYLKKLDKLTEQDFNDEDKGPLVLAEKEPYHTPSIKPEDIADMLADHMDSNNGDNTGDDTSDVYDIIKELDFTATAEMINKALEKKKYYKFTDIEVIPNP